MLQKKSRNKNHFYLENILRTNIPRLKKQIKKYIPKAYYEVNYYYINDRDISNLSALQLRFHNKIVITQNYFNIR